MLLLVLGGEEFSTCHHHNEHVECIFIIHLLACEHCICNVIHDTLFEYLEPVHFFFMFSLLSLISTSSCCPYSSTTETRTGGVPEDQSPVSCGVQLSRVAT